MTPKEEIRLLICIMFMVVANLLWHLLVNKKEARITELEIQVNSLNSNLLKANTALLDSNLHAQCFKLN